MSHAETMDDARELRVIHLELLGPHTRLLSTLCARCPQGSAGCCVSPPEVDWSDVGRIVALGGRDFVLEQLAAGNLLPADDGLRLRRVRKRERPTDPRRMKCVFHGPVGCTIQHQQRPATCNYYLCEDAYETGGERRGDAAAASARKAHGLLREVAQRWDEEIAARVRAAWPEGPPWDAVFLEWLGAEFERLSGASREALASLSGPGVAPPA